MRTRWSGVIGEEPRDRAVRGDLDSGAVIREGALHRGVAREDRSAC
jgi:hypothetical protein